MPFFKVFWLDSDAGITSSHTYKHFVLSHLAPVACFIVDHLGCCMDEVYSCMRAVIIYICCPVRVCYLSYTLHLFFCNAVFCSLQMNAP